MSQSLWRAVNRPRVYALLLFIVALLPRLPGLDLFLTTDESYFIATAGREVILAVLNGHLRGTYWHFYPGVTLSWLQSLGLLAQYGGQLLTGSPPPLADYLHGEVLSLLVAARLPFALLTALAVPAMYGLARRLLPDNVALLGAFFIAVDPFLLAHSRVVHGDGPVTVFMSLSVLAFWVYAQRVSESVNQPNFTDFKYLALSAAAGGLAALTKAPGQFMALFVVGMSIIYAGLAWRQNKHDAGRIFRHWLGVIILWGLMSLAVFVLLWPSMWVDPAGTLRQMLTETFHKVDAGHLVYFMGQATLNPGPWFYPVVIPFRMTPVTLLGVLLTLPLLLPQIKGIEKLPPRPAALWLLWLFVISLLLFGDLSPKKQDRYLLPLFPILNLLAAVGWYQFIQILAEFTVHRSKISDPTGIQGESLRAERSNLHPMSNRDCSPALRPSGRAAQVSAQRTRLAMTYSQSPPEIPKSRIPLIKAALPLVLLLHALPVFTYYPYYLTYFNSLLGGPTRAAGITLIGWGEGMEQVAAYLNTKPNAGQLYVAATPSQTLLPYFKGTGENFYTNDIAFRADYVVLYIAQRQRLAPSPEIVRYFEAQPPEKIITLHGLPYAQIYPNRRLILPDIPAEAVPANIGLDNLMRLAGYTFQPAPPRLTLYWHALAPLSTDYTISVRLLTAAGERLAQQDGWPINGLLPTSQWRQGDYVTDLHAFDLPADTPVERAEIVVYQAGTGQTLGPPIQLTLAPEQ